jgi:hypothetical protein
MSPGLRYLKTAAERLLTRNLEQTRSHGLSIQMILAAVAAVTVRLLVQQEVARLTTGPRHIRLVSLLSDRLHQQLLPLLMQQALARVKTLLRHTA